MPRAWHKDPPPSEDGGLPSKTRRKQAMHALQDLGERLAQLAPDRLAQLALPEQLAGAIEAYRRFNKWEAKRRQMQYIGRLMRGVDAEPIVARLDAWAGTSRAAVAGFHAAEAWRDRLLAEAGALDALVAAYPAADRARFAALIDRARAEREGGRPPANFRLLFRELVPLIDGERSVAAAASPPMDRKS